MELLLIPLVLLLLIALVVAVATGGAPARGRLRRGRRDGETPRVGPDPGAGRPAGPSAESQRTTGAGTLHPPSQSPDQRGRPEAAPPYEAQGKVDPAGAEHERGQ